MAIAIERRNDGRLETVETPEKAGELGEVRSQADFLREQGVRVLGPEAIATAKQPRDDAGRWM